MVAVGLAVLAVALPAQARAADSPRFLLVSAPHGATVRSSPGGAIVAHLPAATPLGAPTWLWVLRTTTNRRWGRVVLPLKPNGRTGWINLHGLRTVHTNTWIRASLHDRRIWLMHGSRPLASFSAAIGAATTPTPAGRFSVTDSLVTSDPSGPFGWYAFGLSGHQPHLPPGWSGGDQLAIHGTDDPASIGTPASHGCLRVSPQALARLRPALHLGTPVVIMPTVDRAMAVAESLRDGRDLLLRLGHRPPPPAADEFATALVLASGALRSNPVAGGQRLPAQRRADGRRRRRRPSSPVALSGPRTATSCAPTPPRFATRTRCTRPRRAPASRSACAA